MAVWGSGEEACVVLVRGQDAAVLRAGAREGSCTELLRRYRVGRVRAFFLPWDGAGERRWGWGFLWVGFLLVWFVGWLWFLWGLAGLLRFCLGYGRVMGKRGMGWRLW